MDSLWLASELYRPGDDTSHQFMLGILSSLKGVLGRKDVPDLQALALSSESLVPLFRRYITPDERGEQSARWDEVIDAALVIVEALLVKSRTSENSVRDPFGGMTWTTQTIQMVAFYADALASKHDPAQPTPVENTLSEVIDWLMFRSDLDTARDREHKSRLKRAVVSLRSGNLAGARRATEGQVSES